MITGIQAASVASANSSASTSVAGFCRESPGFTCGWSSPFGDLITDAVGQVSELEGKRMRQ